MGIAFMGSPMVQSIAAPVQVPLPSIDLDPGSRLTLREVSWETFEVGTSRMLRELRQGLRSQ